MDIYHHQFHSWHILQMSGVCAIKTLNTIRHIFESLQRNGITKIALDLSTITYIDTSTVSFLYNVHKRLKLMHGSLAIYGAHESIQNIFFVEKSCGTIPTFSTCREFMKTVRRE